MEDPGPLPASARAPSCLARVQGMYPDLRPAERRVADFVLQSPMEATRLNITALAARCATSESTVVKLAQRLGYGGYGDFRIALAMEASHRQQPAAPVYGPIEFGDSLDAVREKLLGSYSRALERTFQLLDNATWEMAADALSRAGRLHFYGVGASGIVALDAQQKFARIGLNAWAYVDPHLQSAFAALLSAGDVAVGISHSGGTLDTVHALSTAASSGATTICITHHMDSPLARVAHIRLFTGAEEAPFRSGAIVSRLAQLAVVDALFIAVVMRQGEQAVQRVIRSRQAVQDKHAPPPSERLRRAKGSVARRRQTAQAGSPHKNSEPARQEEGRRSIGEQP